MATNNICSEQAMESIFSQVSPKLRNYLYYKCRNLERAEDLVQDAFLKMWEKCKEILPETASAYVFKVANNLLINLAKKDQVRMKFASTVEESLEYENPEFKLEYDEFKDKLESAISALPDGQREAFLMNRIDKMTYREIAETLGISIKAVEKRMHNALLKMKDILNPKG